jgi:hypothetical protein
MLSTQTMMENATNTYNGKTGCACGCGGRYDDVETISGQKRIKKIMNANPAKVQAFHFGNGEGCLEVENQDGTRVTRVYFKVGA